MISTCRHARVTAFTSACAGGATTFEPAPGPAPRSIARSDLNRGPIDVCPGRPWSLLRALPAASENAAVQVWCERGEHGVEALADHRWRDTDPARSTVAGAAAHWLGPVARRHIDPPSRIRFLFSAHDLHRLVHHPVDCSLAVATLINVRRRCLTGNAVRRDAAIMRDEPGRSRAGMVGRVAA